MIKLFASDLDGTLLNFLHQVDGTIASAIREVTASGAHMALATGRLMRSTGDFGFAGLDIEAVACNGAMVLDRDSQVIRYVAVDPALIEEMLAAFPQICFECVARDGIYVTGSREDRAASFARDNLVHRIIMRGMRGNHDAFESQCVYDQSLAQILAQEVCKINTRVVDPGLERELHAFVDGHADQVVNTPFNPAMFEITDVRATKAASVAWLASRLGIAESEVAVYGDGGNDLAMLERFEHSYATSNGSDDAKRAAGAVIGHCSLHAVPRHMVRTVRAQRARPSYTRIE